MREIISTESAPAAIGPYSQAVRYDNLLFMSGQIPLDPESGEIVEGNIEVQTRKVLDNLKAILEAGGMAICGMAVCGVAVCGMAVCGMAGCGVANDVDIWILSRCRAAWVVQVVDNINSK